MSLTSWKKEFYGSLKEATKSDLAALKHAERTWTGLLPENLERHGGEHPCEEQYIYFPGGSMFAITTESCALCRRHNGDGHDEDRCAGCPLVAARRSCDKERPQRRAPYFVWAEDGNPRPMLRLIRRAIERLEAAGDTP